MERVRWQSIYSYQNVKEGHPRFGWYYIGRTVGRDRVRGHRGEGLLGEDLQVFSDNIVSSVVWTGKCTPEEINEKERHYIKEYGCVSPKGYNLNHGGAGAIELIEETKQKLREVIGVIQNRPEVKQRLRKEMVERWKNPETRKKIIEAMNQPEVKKRNGKVAVKRWEDPEYQEKQRKAHTGKKYEFPSEETKVEMRKAAIKRWENSRYREKVVEAIRTAHSKPETRAKMRKSQQERRRREKEELVGIRYV